MSRAYTKAEMRDLFVGEVLARARYWATVKRSDADKLLGLAHSVLVVLDGMASGMPAFEVIPVPHESDEAYHRSNGSNWWPTPYGAVRKVVESYGIHEGVLLHEMGLVRDVLSESSGVQRGMTPELQIHEVEISGQIYQFTVDEDSVQVSKYESDLKVDSLGSILVYEDQIDGLIEQLTAIKARLSAARSESGEK